MGWRSGLTRWPYSENALSSNPIVDHELFFAEFCMFFLLFWFSHNQKHLTCVDWWTCGPAANWPLTPEVCWDGLQPLCCPALEKQLQKTNEWMNASRGIYQSKMTNTLWLLHLRISDIAFDCFRSFWSWLQSFTFVDSNWESGDFILVSMAPWWIFYLHSDKKPANCILYAAIVHPQIGLPALHMATAEIKSALMNAGHKDNDVIGYWWKSA